MTIDNVWLEFFLLLVQILYDFKLFVLGTHNGKDDVWLFALGNNHVWFRLFALGKNHYDLHNLLLVKIMYDLDYLVLVKMMYDVGTDDVWFSCLFLVQSKRTLIIHHIN